MPTERPAAAPLPGRAEAASASGVEPWTPRKRPGSGEEPDAGRPGSAARLPKLGLAVQVRPPGSAARLPKLGLAVQVRRPPGPLPACPSSASRCRCDPPPGSAARLPKLGLAVQVRPPGSAARLPKLGLAVQVRPLPGSATRLPKLGLAVQVRPLPGSAARLPKLGLAVQVRPPGSAARLPKLGLAVQVRPPGSAARLPKLGLAAQVQPVEKMATAGPTPAGGPQAGRAGVSASGSPSGATGSLAPRGPLTPPWRLGSCPSLFLRPPGPCSPWSPPPSRRPGGNNKAFAGEKEPSLSGPRVQSHVVQG
uniref:collagen alpha-2(I) chain-like n=1 Tax=Halichoerus grypus TaxID=9711 RepID=UPI0016592BD8|nr:collagen alpha-2(I) chain-like [Halichoerus grypus]